MLCGMIFAALLAADNVTTGSTAKITADSTFYNRKEGFACFRGHVSVDDSRYQMHADSAFVFMDGTNAMKRLVAIGNVAITNDTKRAYGAKATYYRNPGFIVLVGSSNVVAEVRDESPKGTQVLRGRKIKFLTESEQIEVIDAQISTPVNNVKDGLKDHIGR